MGDRLLISRSPLHQAAQSGDLAGLQQLLEQGIAVDLPADLDDGWCDIHESLTPLMLAPDCLTLSYLINAGADFQAKDGDGANAFERLLLVETEAAPLELDLMLRCMIEAGADVNAVVGYDDWTRLYMAAFSHQSWVIERLLNLGANPKLGRPPLNGFCWNSNKVFDNNIARGIDLLVAAGCDVNGADAVGDRLIHCAALGYSHSSNFNGSSDGCNSTAVITLLKHGADPNSVSQSGDTPLMLAAEEGSFAAVEVLLANGADPECRDPSGRTALAIAQEAKRLQTEGNANESDPRLKQYYENALQELDRCIRILQAH